MSDASVDIDREAAALLQRLTLKEKFQLLTSPGRHRLYSTKPIARLGIPAFRVTDGPLGVARHSSWKKGTRFPATIALAATWNPALAREMGAAMGQEVRDAGRHMLLAPGINMARTPLNGRNFEYLGEDPLLTREMAVQIVNGIQSRGIGACVKHYAVNNQESDRGSLSAEVDERTLHETYLRAFEGVVRNAQPWSVMAAYNKVNGVYCSENAYLLRETLLDRWGFQGFVMTDWFATRSVESTSACIKAGLSLEMPWPSKYKASRLSKAFRKGEFSEDMLDELVIRYLKVLLKCGAFEQGTNLPEEISTAEHQAVARRIAQEGIVLLKNENDVLPLDRMRTVCVYGPNLRKKYGRFLYGGSSAVVPPHEVTPLEGMRAKNNRTVTRQKPLDIVGSQATVLFVGLDHGRGKDSESRDRESLSLPPAQVEMIVSLAEQSERTVVVVMAGSPIAMEDWIEYVDGVLMAWYPGMEGGHAIADVLYGDVNPSGKLPITFPRRLEDSPAHCTKSTATYPGDGEKRVFYEEGIFIGYRWFDEKEIDPLFPFGYGLSYTEFEISSIQLEREILRSTEDSIRIEFDIRNKGNRCGSEVVQVYASCTEPSVPRPPAELVGFEKVYVEPGETKRTSVSLSSRDLAYYDTESHDWRIDDGAYELALAYSSRALGPLSKIIYKRP
jgi:beta-glucosidase